MLGLLRKLSAKREQSAAQQPPSPPPVVEFPGQPAFVFSEHTETHEGFVWLRWREVSDWVARFPEEEQPKAFLAVADAWDEHLCASLGPAYRVARAPGVVVVSTLEPHLARQTLDFMQKTQRRILRSLEGVARPWEFGNDLLVVIDDEDAYYRFISRFYPDGGEYASSSGVQVNDGGCVYYVCPKGHLRDVEPVIAHEMTHGFVSHLPLPKWLNEGIAVNMEHRLVGAGSPLHTPEQMHARHLAFWNEDTVQALWSGKSFDTAGDSNLLSYDLSRILVEQFSSDWTRFAAFVNEAQFEDAGAGSARRHLGLSLGEAVAALLERDSGARFEPQPPRAN